MLKVYKIFFFLICLITFKPIFAFEINLPAIYETHNFSPIIYQGQTFIALPGVAEEIIIYVEKPTKNSTPLSFRLLITEIEFDQGNDIKPGKILFESTTLQAQEPETEPTGIAVNLGQLKLTPGKKYAWIVDAFSELAQNVDIQNNYLSATIGLAHDNSPVPASIINPLLRPTGNREEHLDDLWTKQKGILAFKMTFTTQKLIANYDSNNAYLELPRVMVDQQVAYDDVVLKLNPNNWQIISAHKANPAYLDSVSSTVYLPAMTVDNAIVLNDVRILLDPLGKWKLLESYIGSYQTNKLPNFNSIDEVLHIPRATLNQKWVFDNSNIVLYEDHHWDVLDNYSQIIPAHFNSATNILYVDYATIDRNIAYLDIELRLNPDGQWSIINMMPEIPPPPPFPYDLTGSWSGRAISSIYPCHIAISGDFIQSEEKIEGTARLSSSCVSGIGTLTAVTRDFTVNGTVAINSSTVNLTGNVSADGKKLFGTYTWPAMQNDRGNWELNIIE